MNIRTHISEWNVRNSKALNYSTLLRNIFPVQLWNCAGMGRDGKRTIACCLDVWFWNFCFLSNWHFWLCLEVDIGTEEKQKKNKKKFFSAESTLAWSVMLKLKGHRSCDSESLSLNCLNGHSFIDEISSTRKHRTGIRQLASGHWLVCLRNPTTILATSHTMQSRYAYTEHQWPD